MYSAGLQHFCLWSYNFSQNMKPGGTISFSALPLVTYMIQVSFKLRSDLRVIYFKFTNASCNYRCKMDNSEDSENICWMKTESRMYGDVQRKRELKVYEVMRNQTQNVKRKMKSPSNHELWPQNIIRNGWGIAMENRIRTAQIQIFCCKILYKKFRKLKYM